MTRDNHPHTLRHGALQQLGKALTRRSGAHCELCEAGGVKLHIYEVPPVPTEPDSEHCLFICDACLEQIEAPKRRDPNYWHCLGRTAWSPIPVVQVLSVHLLQGLVDQAEWPQELLDELYLSPDVAAWVKKIER